MFMPSEQKTCFILMFCQINNIYTNRVSIKAKGKAFDMMTYIFGALMVSFALMDVDMTPLLLLVFAYLFVHGFSIYYRMKFDKEM